MGLVGLLFGSMLANWARLTDHGRWVTTGGPYRLVRHPACLGLIVSALGTAVMLGSDWAMLPTGLLIGLVVIRTVLEDRALQAELPGYLGYTRRVPFRLLPGLW
jgi:protein-S-isoprenylcysteine O-methyltransferase Ste14